jgi:succinate-semialdehyde dehydrogenase / glutarate-semialdehyde dehydrogenase
MPYATVNPASGETIASFDEIADAELDRLIESAGRTFGQWKDRPAVDRAAVVSRAADLLRDRADDIARLVTLEMGKLIGESRAELKLACAILRYYGKNGPEFLKPEALDVPGGTASVVKEPLGVLLGIEPWNFPLYQVVRFAAPNLVAGNTILLKHASINPQCALALEQLFRDAGAPEGAYTNLFVSTDQVKRAIEHPLVRGVSLTGSDAAGKAVAEAAGKNLKKVVLELGGSDPFIVLDDHNIERTVRAAVLGRMMNTGQSCTASKRFIVVEPAYDALVDGMKQAFAQLQPGDPMDPNTNLGPLSSESALQKLLEQVDDAIDNGASLVIGGKRVQRKGAFMEPTILTGVTPKMRAYGEELFGPVAVIYKVEDDDAAANLANTSEFGLGGSIFCGDLDRAARMAERIESGMVWVNHPTVSLPNLPFGGIKHSGFGRELSELGINEFLNQKLICTMPSDAKLIGAGG